MFLWHNLKKDKEKGSDILKKGLLTIGLTLLFIFVLSFSVFAEEKADKEKMSIHTVEVTLDGRRILNENNKDTARLINGVTYVPLRSICSEMGDIVEWDEGRRTANVYGINMNITVTENQRYITVNDRCFYCPTGNLIFDGKIFVPIRVISRAYGLDVFWEMTSNGGVVSLIQAGNRAEKAEDVYDGEVLYWMSRIISAESRGESLEGQIAVGNVVLNRVRSKDFPNTVYDVIFDRKFGVQFTPTVNGMIYEVPYDISIIAAKICLEGYTLSEDIIYFLNIAASDNLWVPNNRDYVMTLGCHTFYS